jgi:hypothetical protein
MPKPLSRSRDYIGEQIANILSYRDIISSWVREVKVDPDECQKAKAVIFNYIKGRCREGISALDQLTNLSKSRKPATTDDRAIQYFQSIFPPVKPCLRRRYQPIQADRFYYSSLLPAIDTAQNLLQLKRFLDPQKTWTEAKLFKKEKLYAQRLEKNPYFVADINRLFKIHRAMISKIKRDIYIDMDYADQTEAKFDNIKDLPVREHFKYKLAVLCYRHCLSGLTKDLKPIPLPFQIQLDGCIARITIPNYMEIDWRRDIPGDVIEFLQKRGSIESRIKPIRLSNQDRPSGHGETDTLILIRYNELCQQKKLSRTNNMNWVYDTLCKEFPISSAQNLEDKRRVCRRRIKNIRRH